MLSPEGERNFISVWKSFEYPRQWSKLPNPISHIETFMMSDRLRLGMVKPFILNRSLTINCLKPQEIEKLQERTNMNRNQVISNIIKCWATVAKYSQLAFKISLTKNDYIELENYLNKERKALIELSDEFVDLPNLHANYHLLRHARTFSTLTNTAVGIKEMVHRIFKNIVPHTNFKNIELDLLKRLFKDWFIMENSEMNNEKLEVCLQSSEFRNIVLRKPASIRNTNIGINTISFHSDLALAYKSFGYHASLINKACNFYEYVSYIQVVQNVEIQCHLNKGDIVTIKEVDYGESYAVIKGIFKHQNNDGYYYPFIYVDWFEDTYKKHNKLDCPIFVLRHDDYYCKIFPLTVIDKVQKAYFVHDCNARCKESDHFLENNHYLKNEFFFAAV
ncbi:hypothetical protein RhiirA5_473917 [Rhizophagus irregularis]|uniref:BAH domain-containing protein n=2 Tax=Rhizophagus irregularis TaxID=588596 RepID=A0A2N0NMA9_9GLOM|nr:hypothetical protein RhiirA5_473917 [Rhizophagus irregularis]